MLILRGAKLLKISHATKCLRKYFVFVCTSGRKCCKCALGFTVAKQVRQRNNIVDIWRVYQI